MRNDQYFIIDGWMINDLHLKGTDLLIYAMIKSSIRSWRLSYIRYLSEVLGISESTVKRSLSDLCKKKLIISEECYTEANNHYMRYSINEEAIEKYNEVESSDSMVKDIMDEFNSAVEDAVNEYKAQQKQKYDSYEKLFKEMTEEAHKEAKELDEGFAELNAELDKLEEAIKKRH